MDILIETEHVEIIIFINLKLILYNVNEILHVIIYNN